MDTILLSGIIGAVGFGVLSAIVATKKNRDNVGWFFLGFLFGPFGFVASLVVEELEPDQNQVRASTSSKHASDPRAFPAMLSTSSIEDEEVHCPECMELVKAVARRCKHCGASLNVDSDSTPHEGLRGVSVSEYQRLARRRTIISRVQDDESYIRIMPESDWEFTLAQGIDEIASSVSTLVEQNIPIYVEEIRNAYSQKERELTQKKRELIEQVKEYFAHVDRDIATRETYDLMSSNHSDIGILSLELIDDLQLLDLRKSAELLRSGELDVRKRALASFRLHPRRYFREDVGHLKDAKARVPSAFPIIAEEVEIDRFLKSKPAVKWECPCDNQNDLKVEYCTSCGKNRRGFTRDELKPEEAVNVIDNRIALLEELLSVEN